jgi:hypothetical protein
MVIDPRLYEKLSGRKGDPYDRLGAALASDVKKKQERDAMPKGVAGGLKVTSMPGIWANLLLALKLKRRDQEG